MKKRNVMDAVKFLKNYIRMCKTVDNCKDCTCCGADFCTKSMKSQSQESAEEIVQIVEEWAAAHPVKTRQSVFLKQWPDAEISDGYLFCPQKLNWRYLPEEGCSCTRCEDCRRYFWMQEVE